MSRWSRYRWSCACYRRKCESTCDKAENKRPQRSYYLFTSKQRGCQYHTSPFGGLEHPTWDISRFTADKKPIGTSIRPPILTSTDRQSGPEVVTFTPSTRTHDATDRSKQSPSNDYDHSLLLSDSSPASERLSVRPSGTWPPAAAGIVKYDKPKFPAARYQRQTSQRPLTVQRGQYSSGPYISVH